MNKPLQVSNRQIRKAARSFSHGPFTPTPIQGLGEKYRLIFNKQMRIADKAFWNWFIHSDEPPLAWWETTGPYCNWLKALREDGLIPPVRA